VFLKKSTHALFKNSACESEIRADSSRREIIKALAQRRQEPWALLAQ